MNNSQAFAFGALSSLRSTNESNKDQNIPLNSSLSTNSNPALFAAFKATADSTNSNNSSHSLSFSPFSTLSSPFSNLSNPSNPSNPSINSNLAEKLKSPITSSFPLNSFGLTSSFSSVNKPSFVQDPNVNLSKQFVPSIPKTHQNQQTNNFKHSETTKFYGPNVCRVCGLKCQDSFDLKKHIKAEKHYDIPVATFNNGAIASTSDFISKSASLLDNNSGSTNLLIPKRKPITESSVLVSTSLSNNANDNVKTVSMGPFDNEPTDRMKLLREKLLNKKTKSDSNADNSFETSLMTPIKVVPANNGISFDHQPPNIIANGSPDYDFGRRDDGTALCTDMCPKPEREIRASDYGALHELEQCDPSNPLFATLRQTMIKKFQKSAADHDLNVPELIRTSRTLLKTILYIENNIVDLIDSESEETSAVIVYLFIWDRYRMIAKDYTLMNPNLGVNSIWIECHERMARMYIYMDHRMKADEEYMKAGHGQQNGESLNNIFKTLYTYYNTAKLTNIQSNNMNSTLLCPNKGEFIGYFIIFQIGNKGEITKFLQQLDDEYFSSVNVKFAVSVWVAIKTGNYSKFFKLLHNATILQASLMHKYVSEVRVMALRRICRSYHSSQVYLVELQSLLCFENIQEVVYFLHHCGLEVHLLNEEEQVVRVLGESDEIDDSINEELLCFLIDQKTTVQVPVDKNGLSIAPIASYMENEIESKRYQRISLSIDDSGIFSSTVDYDLEPLSISKICRGYASSNASIFDDALCLSLSPDENGSIIEVDEDNFDYEVSSQEDDEEDNDISTIEASREQSSNMIREQENARLLQLQQEKEKVLRVQQQKEREAQQAEIDKQKRLFEEEKKKRLEESERLRLLEIEQEKRRKEAEIRLAEEEKQRHLQQQLQEQERLRLEMEAKERERLLQLQLEAEELHRQKVLAAQEAERIRLLEETRRKREEFCEHLIVKLTVKRNEKLQRAVFFWLHETAKSYRYEDQAKSREISSRQIKLSFRHWYDTFMQKRNKRLLFFDDITNILITSNKIHEYEHDVIRRFTNTIQKRSITSEKLGHLSFEKALHYLIDKTYNANKNLEKLDIINKFLPLEIPKLIHHSLLLAYQRRVHIYYQDHQSLTNVSEYSTLCKTLYMKMAIFNPFSNTKSGYWNHRENILCNFMRLLVSNFHLPNVSNEVKTCPINGGGRWKDVFLESHENHYYKVDVSLIDVTKAYQDQCHGIQANLICIPFVDRIGETYDNHSYYLSQSSKSPCIICIVIPSIVPIQGIQCHEVDINNIEDDFVFDYISLLIQKKVLSRDIIEFGLEAIYVINYNSVYSKEDHIDYIAMANSCRNLLSIAILKLIDSKKLHIPLLQKLHVLPWIQSILRPISTIQAIESKLKESIKAIESISNRISLQEYFPLQDFFKDETLDVVEDCIFENIPLTINRQDFHLKNVDRSNVEYVSIIHHLKDILRCYDDLSCIDVIRIQHWIDKYSLYESYSFYSSELDHIMKLVSISQDQSRLLQRIVQIQLLIVFNNEPKVTYIIPEDMSYKSNPFIQLTRPLYENKQIDDNNIDCSLTMKKRIRSLVNIIPEVVDDPIEIITTPQIDEDEIFQQILIRKYDTNKDIERSQYAKRSKTNVVQNENLIVNALNVSDLNQFISEEIEAREYLNEYLFQTTQNLY